MLRVKNESSKIIACLSSILPLFDEIVLVDNASADGTFDIVTQFKAENDREDALHVFQYPHTVARCGDEHWATPEDSVQSLVYYYNWCLSKCHHDYVFKWDADMVVAQNEGGELKKLFRSLPRDMSTLWWIPVQTLYRGHDGVWYRARSEINRELRLAPNRAAVRFWKARYWEQLRSEVQLRRQFFGPVCIYELKDVAEDEFSNWSTAEFPTKRKQREWTNYNLVKAGEASDALFERLNGPIADGEPRPPQSCRKASGP